MSASPRTAGFAVSGRRATSWRSKRWPASSKRNRARPRGEDRGSPPAARARCRRDPHAGRAPVRDRLDRNRIRRRRHQDPRRARTRRNNSSAAGRDKRRGAATAATARCREAGDQRRQPPRHRHLADRGEIALRIHRACHELGIKTVAVHSTADAHAMNVRLADETVCIGPPPARASYLNVSAILSAAAITGADAIHPGVGFLSENADFAAAVEEHGFTFIGPSPEHIRLMGDKVRAKAEVQRLGLPTVPGSPEAVRDVAAAEEAARAIGYPVLLKASAGGGGRGLKLARDPAELRHLLPLAQAEAKAAFGDDAVYLERFLERPRHIEVQLLGDGRGNVIHLGERDCSLQRSHQKLLEESPSPALDRIARDRLTGVASAALQELGYRSAGT